MSARIAILASGDGSNFEAIVRASQDGSLPAQVVGLISNRQGVGVLARAEKLHVPAAVISPKKFSDRAAWDEAMLAQLRAWQTDLVVLAGYLALIGPSVLNAFPERIVNSHPSLLPRYGGSGMYGGRVHEAVIAAREAETGITVHLVDEVYDRGRVLAQLKIPVIPGESAHDLERRVKQQENLFYPKVLANLVGRLLGNC